MWCILIIIFLYRKQVDASHPFKVNWDTLSYLPYLTYHALPYLTYLTVFCRFSYLSTYVPFKYLLSKSADQFVEKFISREHSLKDYRKEIENFNRMASQVTLLPVLVPMHLFVLDCHQLNQVWGSSFLVSTPNFCFFISILFVSFKIFSEVHWNIAFCGDIYLI